MLSLNLGPALIFTILSKLRCGCDCLDKIVQREILDSSFSERGRDWLRAAIFIQLSSDRSVETVAAFFSISHIPTVATIFPPDMAVSDREQKTTKIIFGAKKK